MGFHISRDATRWPIFPQSSTALSHEHTFIQQPVGLHVHIHTEHHHPHPKTCRAGAPDRKYSVPMVAHGKWHTLIGHVRWTDWIHGGVLENVAAKGTEIPEDSSVEQSPWQLANLRALV